MGGANLVCISGFDTLLQRLRLTAQLLDSLFLSREGGLHRVEHLHLFFFKTLDTVLSLLLLAESFTSLIAVGVSGAHVISVDVVTLVSHHILSLVVHVGCVFGLVGVIVELFLKEVVVV